MVVKSLSGTIKDQGAQDLIHSDNMYFQQAIKQGTIEDFKKEMNQLYPDKYNHFKGMN